MNWHIITCEYPPQVGGVSGYTQLLTQKLVEAGDNVHVYAPVATPPVSDGPDLHRSLGKFSSADFRATSLRLDQHPGPLTLLVQWVPHGYGRRSMNVAFCRWIASRARRGDRIYLMVHEPFLEFGHGWLQNAVALVHRHMIRTLLRVATRVFISIPAWEGYLRRYAPPAMKFEWLPVPATIPRRQNASEIADIRIRLGHDSIILGHLGTYSSQLTRVLQPALEQILRDTPNAHVLLLGKHSDAFARDLQRHASESASRIHGPGHLDDVALSHHISACDLMLQPYPDGLSSRRTSLMNLLSHAVPVVSNSGHLTEPLWNHANAVALACKPDAAELASLCTKLLRDHASRQQMSQAGLNFYRDRFDWPNVIAILRSSSDVDRGFAASTTSNQSGSGSQLE